MRCVVWHMGVLPAPCSATAACFVTRACHAATICTRCNHHPILTTPPSRLTQVHRRTGLRIYADARKIGVLGCYHTPEQMAALFTSDPLATPIHITGWGFQVRGAAAHVGMRGEGRVWDVRPCARKCAPAAVRHERLCCTRSGLLPQHIARTQRTCALQGETWPYFRPNFTNLENLRVQYGAQEVRGGAGQMGLSRGRMRSERARVHTHARVRALYNQHSRPSRFPANAGHWLRAHGLDARDRQSHDRVSAQPRLRCRTWPGPFPRAREGGAAPAHPPGPIQVVSRGLSAAPLCTTSPCARSVAAQPPLSPMPLLLLRAASTRRSWS